MDLGIHWKTNTKTNTNTKFQTQLIVDASHKRLGAQLIQVNPEDQDDYSIIAYACRSFSDVEFRYSHLEKECFAMVWGFVKF